MLHVSAMIQKIFFYSKSERFKDSLKDTLAMLPYNRATLPKSQNFNNNTLIITYNVF